MYKRQLCPAEIMLILNAKESTFLVDPMLRVFQTVQVTLVQDPSGRLLKSKAPYSSYLQ